MRKVRHPNFAREVNHEKHLNYTHAEPVSSRSRLTVAGSVESGNPTAARVHELNKKDEECQTT